MMNHHIYFHSPPPRPLPPTASPVTPAFPEPPEPPEPDLVCAELPSLNEPSVLLDILSVLDQDQRLPPLEVTVENRGDHITPQNQPVDMRPDVLSSAVTCMSEDVVPIEVPLDFVLPNTSFDVEMPDVVKQKEEKKTPKRKKRAISVGGREGGKVEGKAPKVDGKAPKVEGGGARESKSPKIKSPKQKKGAVKRGKKEEMVTCAPPLDASWMFEHDVSGLEKVVGKVPTDALNYAFTESRNRAVNEANNRKKMQREAVKASQVSVVPADKRARAASRMEAGLSRHHKEYLKEAMEEQLKMVVKENLLLWKVLGVQGGGVKVEGEGVGSSDVANSKRQRTD